MMTISPQRIALINPTKFLGNLLLAGGHIQHLGHWCQAHNVQLLVVLDEGFRELLGDALAGAALVYYPRKALQPGATDWRGLMAWVRCVREIRRFQADLAFTIEEDSVCHRLTHFSGATRKLSSTPHRYHFGFDEVLSIPRSGRAPDQAHIWHSFRDVLLAVGLPAADVPAYMQLRAQTPTDNLRQRLQQCGLTLDKPFAVIHAGASKRYKKWPTAHFIELTGLLAERGLQAVLIGAGRSDAADNSAITQAVGQGCVDLCNQLSLQELASLLSMADLMVGNDSGPSHLASALGIRGVVIFGPTELAIWHPLGEHTRVLHNKQLCATSCTRHRCDTDYQCLRLLTPDQVVSALFDGNSAANQRSINTEQASNQ